MVEHLVCNQGVVGSNPLASTRRLLNRLCLTQVAAQLVRLVSVPTFRHDERMLNRRSRKARRSLKTR